MPGNSETGPVVQREIRVSGSCGNLLVGPPYPPEFSIGLRHLLERSLQANDKIRHGGENL